MTWKLADPTLLRDEAFVDGEWVKGKTRYTLADPATGETLAEVTRLGAEDTRRAIEAAHRAFLAYRRTTAKQRGELLRRWHDLLLEHREDVATIIVREEGKPLAEARGEVDYAA